MTLLSRQLPPWLLASVLVLLPTSSALAEIVDFEDLTPATSYTGPGGVEYWNGSDRSGGFTSNGVFFVNRYNTKYGSWDGFAYSNTTDTTTAGYTNQFSAVVGGGYGGSRNYAVGYANVWAVNDTELPYLQLPADRRVESVYITNTTYAALSMRDGDPTDPPGQSFAKKFGGATGNDPDWFLLKIFGCNGAGDRLSDSVELYLADFRSSDNADDYIIDDWTLVDLSPLAEARTLYFQLTSTDNHPDWGMNTPAYFAIDDLVLSIVPEPSAAVLLGIGGLSLGGILLRRRRRAGT